MSFKKKEEEEKEKLGSATPQKTKKQSKKLSVGSPKESLINQVDGDDLDGSRIEQLLNVSKKKSLEMSIHQSSAQKNLNNQSMNKSFDSFAISLYDYQENAHIMSQPSHVSKTNQSLSKTAPPTRAISDIDSKTIEDLGKNCKFYSRQIEIMLNQKLINSTRELSILVHLHQLKFPSLRDCQHASKHHDFEMQLNKLSKMQVGKIRSIIAQLVSHVESNSPRRTPQMKQASDASLQIKEQLETYIFVNYPNIQGKVCTDQLLDPAAMAHQFADKVVT